jgi:hypothetical protein
MHEPLGLDGENGMRIHFYTDCENVADEAGEKWDTGPMGDLVTCVVCLEAMIEDRVLILP